MAPDAYRRGRWISGRDAKVITYHKDFGEVGRITVSYDMVAKPKDSLDIQRSQTVTHNFEKGETWQLTRNSRF